MHRVAAARGEPSNPEVPVKLSNVLRIAVAGIVGGAVLASVAAASTIKLKNGTTLVGEARKLGGSYSIVQTDGSRKMIPAAEIASIDDVPVGGGIATIDDAVPTTGPSVPQNVTAAFKAAKAKADHVDAPVIAVQVWEEFIAKHPSAADLVAAESEKAVWDKLYKDKAERIKNKWVGGKELVDLKKKCNDLLREAIDPGDDGVKGVNGLHKLDEILALYPNQFEANFYKGYYYLVQAIRTRVGSNDALAKAMVALERTAAIAPDAPEVWCNLAIGYNFRREYQKSIEAAYRAVKMRDDDEDLVAILRTALDQAPPQMREGEREGPQDQRGRAGPLHALQDRRQDRLALRPARPSAPAIRPPTTPASPSAPSGAAAASSSRRAATSSRTATSRRATRRARSTAA